MSPAVSYMSQPRPPTLDITSTIRRSWQDQLDTLVNSGTGITAAFISTSDGRHLLHHSKDRDGHRVAAMSSSLLALGETVSRELTLDPCRNVLVECAGGYAVVLRIPDAFGRLLLTCVSSNTGQLGMLLSKSKICATALGRGVESLSLPK